MPTASRPGRKQGGRLALDRPAVHQGRVFPAAAVGHLAFAYNAAASGASNWGASNPLLRDRVARALGPIVTYKEGQAGGAGHRHLVPEGPVPRQTRHRGPVGENPSHPGAELGQGRPAKHRYVAAWQKAHPDEVAQWIKDNPGTPQPKPADLAVPFFDGFSASSPAPFPRPWNTKQPMAR